MIKFTLLLFVLCASLFAGDKKPCCGPTPTESFAAFGKDLAFVALHEAPEPFVLQSSRGSMRSLKTSDGIEAIIYEVPAAQATNNVLFVFHEWWGLNDYIKREAENIQRELGNVTVIAVDLYDGKIADTPDSARAFVGRVRDDRARTIIAAAMEYVGKKVKIATLGWCFGGGWSMQASLMLGKQAAGCVIYYGMPENDVKKLKSLNCDVLGIFATQDGFISPQIVSEFQKNMKSAGKNLTVRNFNAVHAFANPSNPNHDKEMTAQANVQMVAFLKKAFKIQ
jgi:carboxymethylenebutenolidase